MRHLTKAFIALLVAGTPAVAVAGPASANGPLVNVVVQDVLSGNQVVVLQNASIVAAAVLCDVNVNVLTNQLDQDGKGSCPALTDITQIGKVVYS